MGHANARDRQDRRANWRENVARSGEAWRGVAWRGVADCFLEAVPTRRLLFTARLGLERPLLHRKKTPHHSSRRFESKSRFPNHKSKRPRRFAESLFLLEEKICGENFHAVRWVNFVKNGKISAGNRVNATLELNVFLMAKLSPKPTKAKRS